MGIINSAIHDTTPGGDGVFAPPEGWGGDTDGYLALMRERLDEVEGGQHLIVAARFFRREPEAVVIHGPYKKEVLKILNKLSDS